MTNEWGTDIDIRMLSQHTVQIGPMAEATRTPLIQVTLDAETGWWTVYVRDRTGQWHLATRIMPPEVPGPVEPPRLISDPATPGENPYLPEDDRKWLETAMPFLVGPLDGEAAARAQARINEIGRTIATALAQGDDPTPITVNVYPNWSSDSEPPDLPPRIRDLFFPNPPGRGR